MFRKLQAFAAIVKITVIESIQEPAALLVMLAAILITLLAPLFHFHSFGEEGRLARDGGLASLLVFGLCWHPRLRALQLCIDARVCGGRRRTKNVQIV